ncbi:acetoin utilization protein AcuC [Brachybacterium hainanense]|uniref:Acetoin utilization protein AcuC n=1 Tax=Brachybacterium hainanense TaxID=1541174 RepID=A0ABV6RFW2_9MICO
MSSDALAPVPDGTAVVWDPSLLAYDFGPLHPMSPIRLQLTELLARSTGVLDRPGVRLLVPGVASDEELGLVHDRAYIAAVRRASSPEALPAADELIGFGIGGEDVPAFPGMHEASARIVGGSIEAVDAIRAGLVTRAVNFAGGMHHARPSQAAGFCVYNDAAVAITHALRAGEERVLYIDLDVHHGDGVERALWDEPRAVTLSVHESGEHLFPGTGFVQDQGGAGALGTAVNLPLPPRTDADGWLRALGAVIPPLVAAVRPTLLVTQHGADTHRSDPLADLRVSLEAQREAMILMREMADAHTGGRWLALGGGGYSVFDVVPRSWTHLLAVATGEPLDPAAPLPPEYLAGARRLLGTMGLGEARIGETFGDGRALAPRPWIGGYDPQDDLDRAVQAARRSAFPEWGLDPFLD